MKVYSTGCSDLRLNWWDLMNALADAERVVWHLFVGDHPTPESKGQYAKWRADYLEGKNIKVDALSAPAAPRE